VQKKDFAIAIELSEGKVQVSLRASKPDGWSGRVGFELEVICVGTKIDWIGDGKY